MAWPAGCAHAGVVAETLTVNDLLAGLVRLDVESLDRIYLNGYVPKLQVAGPGRYVEPRIDAGRSVA